MRVPSRGLTKCRAALQVPVLLAGIVSANGQGGLELALSVSRNDMSTLTPEMPRDRASFNQWKAYVP